MGRIPWILEHPPTARLPVACLLAVGALCLSLTGAPGCGARPAEPPTTTLSKQQLVDMVVGSAILCTRGSDTQAQIDRVTQAVAEGKQFRLLALEHVPDDWTGFTAFGVGGGGAWAHVIERAKAQGLGPAAGARPAPLGPTAANLLAEHLKRTFQVTFEAEAGGATTNALLTAEALGIPLLDACPSGRCLPEVQMSSFFLAGIPRAPLAVVTRYGDHLLVPAAVDDYRVEDLTRAFAVASGGGVTVAANAVSGKTMKANLIPGFLSKAMALGRAAREATAAGRDPVDAVIAAGQGYLLFRGIVETSDSRGERGFGWTEASLRGTGAFAGSRYRIYNKNENMIAWRDGKLDASAPDLIAALDPRTGWAMRGGAVIGAFTPGDDLAIVGFPNHALWRTPKGIELLGPRHFGFDEPYVPIERGRSRS